MIKAIRFSVTLLIFCVFFFFLGLMYGKEHTKREPKDIVLADCPLCGRDTAKLQMANQSYYICCDYCGIKTNGYEDLVELINDWNNKKVRGIQSTTTHLKVHGL